jgi:hypothetical protein
MLAHPDILPTDDGRFAIGLADDAPGPFQSRQHAAAVAALLVARANRQPAATDAARRVGR